MKEERLIPLAALEKLLKKAGAERVSVSACVALKEHLEELSADIGKKATTFALHAGRKTLKGSDIKLALKQ